MSRRSSTGSSKHAASARAASRRRAKSNSGSRAAGARAASAGSLLHLDAFSGIAGNMFVGALLDLGLERKALEADLAGLPVKFALEVRRVRRGGLAARHVRVVVPRSGRMRQGGDRRYLDVVRVLERARLAGAVRDRALAIFEALGKAEARVHGIPLEKVHFHEVGAVDAIVDVTAAAAGLERLGVTRVTCSRVAVGRGSVDTDHGRLPLPAPAALELLRGVPVTAAGVDWETVTPTGAAILHTVVSEYRDLPRMTIEAIGHGAGDDRPGPLPNVLRAIRGSGAAARWDRVIALETNLDDFVPEHFDYLMERLFEAGALDVSIQHLQMKKNRPGFLVRILARPSDRVPLADILFAESTALGVRTTDFERLVLDREVRRVDTPYGRIGVKIARDGSGRVNVSAEYDDCKKAARRARVPLREVVRAAEGAAWREL